MRGWHSRGYLPHFESEAAVQHVTFHLADSLPASVVQKIQKALMSLPAERRDVEKRKRLEAWIDAGHGSCVLGRIKIAEMIESGLFYFDGERYRLMSWVVMPNHVHALFQAMDGWSVAKIVAGWKKFMARGICDSLRKQSEKADMPIWHREYWDRYIRDEGHLEKVKEYIHLNPVKAGLVDKAEDWRWSSAFGGRGG